MGSVVIIFLPILLPLIIILGTAEKLGYDPIEVLFFPLSVLLEIIIRVFFGGSTEAFYGFLETVTDKTVSFLTENEGELAAISEKIADFLGKFI